MFRNNILNSDLINGPHKTVISTSSYSETSLIDMHPPIGPKHQATGFVNPEILASKRLKCRLERAWQRDNSATIRRFYRMAVNRHNRLLAKSKRNDFEKVILENQHKPRALWDSFKAILHKTANKVLRITLMLVI